MPQRQLTERCAAERPESCEPGELAANARQYLGGGAWLRQSGGDLAEPGLAYHGESLQHTGAKLVVVHRLAKQLERQLGDCSGAHDDGAEEHEA